MDKHEKARSNTIMTIWWCGVLLMTIYSANNGILEREARKDVCNSIYWNKIGFWYKGAINIGTDGSTAVITHIWQDNVEATNCLSDYAQSKKEIKVRGETFIPMTMDFAFITDVPAVLEDAGGEKYNMYKFAEESIIAYGKAGAEYLLISAPLKGSESYARIIIVAEAMPSSRK